MATMMGTKPLPFRSLLFTEVFGGLLLITTTNRKHQVIGDVISDCDNAILEARALTLYMYSNVTFSVHNTGNVYAVLQKHSIAKTMWEGYFDWEDAPIKNCLFGFRDRRFAWWCPLRTSQLFKNYYLSMIQSLSKDNFPLLG